MPANHSRLLLASSRTALAALTCSVALLLALGLGTPGTLCAEEDAPAPLPPDSLDMAKMRAAIVQVFTVSQDESYRRPWQRPEPQESSGSGFYVGERRLLTNAHVVANAKHLMVKRADRVKRYPARVLYAGHDCDLAAITVDDDSFWEGMEPLEIAKRPALRDTVMTIGYPTGGTRLSVTQGVVSRIEMRTYVHSNADQHLTIQTDAAINPGNSGGPVIRDGKVVGVAFQGMFFSQNIGYMIPPSVIEHFLIDIRDDIYHGYPELGIYTAGLENGTLRSFLGVPEGNEQGVVVLKPMPYASCWGQLQKNDVLLAIDGVPIESDGTVKEGDEFFDFAWIVENKQIGETVVLTILRAGKQLELKITLKGWGARMQQRNVYDERPEYLVLGGYLFVPLTQNYLGWGSSNEISYYMEQYYLTVAEEGKTREQLVLLSHVLPHESTRYVSYSDAIVASVDGKVPNDFREFVKLIGESKNELIRVEFEGVNVAPLILDMPSIKRVHPDILKKYQIPEDRYVEGQK